MHFTHCVILLLLFSRLDPSNLQLSVNAQTRGRSNCAPQLSHHYCVLSESNFVCTIPSSTLKIDQEIEFKIRCERSVHNSN
jgi:hypothetical protein